jgi:hypothetical protein
MSSKYRLVIPIGLRPLLADYEISSAEILAEYFKSDIEFVSRSNQKRPDFLINGMLWELKSPTGTGKHTIKRQLQTAWHQSPNVVIDASRSKMHGTRIRREVEYQFRIVKSVKKLLFISKAGKVIEITR